jgi:acetylglutamate kinase
VADKPELGLVGELSSVDTKVIDALTPGFIPVVAPLAIGESGETLNVNADAFAGSLAVALRAEKLVLLTDVEGVLDADGKLLPSITATEARALIGSGVIAGGMIPKVENALSAVAGGVHKVHVIDGRLEHALLLEVFTRSGVGTQVVSEGEKQ